MHRPAGLHGRCGSISIGVDAAARHCARLPERRAEDVRLHAALRADRAEAELLLWEVESLLCCGPAGGGGYRGQITPSVVTHGA